MKTNQWFLAGVACAWLICATAHGQQPEFPPMYSAPAPIPAQGGHGSPNGYHGGHSGVLSDWMEYNNNATAVRRDYCCEPRPYHPTPIYTELFVRFGPSFPVGGDTLSRELQTGWSFVGGGRALFFNESMTKAWTFEPHIINTNECGVKNPTPFAVTIVNQGIAIPFGKFGIPGVTVQSSNRTMVGLGVGREYYLWEPANSDGCKCRVGFDGGGRWGSHRLDLDQTHHLTDVIGTAYAAVHSDVEVPTKYGLFQYGIRVEWAYTWSDILQQQTNVQDLNILLTMGLRF